MMGAFVGRRHGRCPEIKRFPDTGPAVIRRYRPGFQGIYGCQKSLSPARQGHISRKNWTLLMHQDTHDHTHTEQLAMTVQAIGDIPRRNIGTSEPAVNQSDGHCRA